MARRRGPSGAAASPEPDPDQEQMVVDTLMTSVFTGICFTIAIVVYAITGGVGLFVVSDASRATAMVVFGIGLTIGFFLLFYVLKAYGVFLEARSRNLYRGAWIGMLLGLAIIVLMYYFPWVAVPNYCPPGAVCA